MAQTFWEPRAKVCHFIRESQKSSKWIPMGDAYRTIFRNEPQ